MHDTIKQHTDYMTASGQKRPLGHGRGITMLRVLRMLLVGWLLCGATGLYASDAVIGDSSLNAMDFFHKSSDALTKNDPASAAIAFLMGDIRAEADYHCFPPSNEADDGVVKVRDENAILGGSIYSLLNKDPKLFASVISTVDAWTASTSPAYKPGWSSKSRCDDYAKAASDSKEFTLQPLRSLSHLLNIPEYFKAYSVYNDVYQDYLVAPPDDAYSPARISAAADAKKTIMEIERSTGVSALGAALAYQDGSPLSFRVLVSGSTMSPVQFPQTAIADPAMVGNPGEVEVAKSPESFDKLWNAIYPGGASPSKKPDVDFATQYVVAAFAGARLASTAAMFINRIDYDPRFSGAIVYIRVPVAMQKKCAKIVRDYPFVIAVFEKPPKGPVTTSYDRQNFPFSGC
jgi:hypothetical protein